MYRRSVVYGWTQQRIADHYGLVQQTVAEILARVAASMAPPDRRELIDAQLEAIKEYHTGAMEIYELAAAPVAVGKDGNILHDPDTGAVVRDYSGKLRALETAMKAADMMARRMGLDSATKTESTATVKYVLEGVNMEALK